MSDQIINIPGVGDIAFPDSMSEQDITAAAKRLYEGGAVPRQGDLRPVPNTITDSIPDTGPLGVVKGGAESALSTGAGIRRLIGAAGEATGIDLPGVDIGITADQYTDRRRAWAPGTPAEKIGRGVEQMAEFMVPAGKAAQLTKGATGVPGVLARASAQGVAGGAVGAAQAGDIEGGIVPGVTAAVLPIVGAGLQSLGRRVMSTAIEGSVS